MGEEILGRSVLVVVMVVAGVALLWVARAAAGGRLGRNPYAGIRLPVTMASDEAWLVAHRAAERPTRSAGWCGIAAAVPAALPVPVEVALVAVLAGAVVMLALVVRGAVLGTRAARAGADGGRP